MARHQQVDKLNERDLSETEREATANKTSSIVRIVNNTMSLLMAKSVEPFLLLEIKTCKDRILL
jgi:hypothetical protein